MGRRVLDGGHHGPGICGFSLLISMMPASSRLAWGCQASQSQIDKSLNTIYCPGPFRPVSSLPTCPPFELPGDLNHTTETVIQQRASLIVASQPKAVRAGGTMIKMKKRRRLTGFQQPPFGEWLRQLGLPLLKTIRRKRRNHHSRANADGSVEEQTNVWHRVTK